MPYSDPLYYEVRSSIALPPPQEEGGVLPLDSRFGLHPALAKLMPLWQQNQLGFIHCCGSPDGTRSHFDAQAYIESGTPGNKRTADGWMNRLLATLSQHSPIQALNVGITTPKILTGKMSVATLAPGPTATKPLSLDRPQVEATFARLYEGQDPLSRAYQEGKVARQILLNELAQEMDMANNGAASAAVFVQDAQRLGSLMSQDARIKLGFMAVGGWDTHINQGNQQGQLARQLGQLGQGLVTLKSALGKTFDQTTIIVMSEFGRTVKENGNGGTDHGRGNAAWVLGGNINGGKVYGDWRGLEPEQLEEGRDLPVTTDFRDVLATVLTKNLGLDTLQVSQVLPQYRPTYQVTDLV